MFRFSPVGAGGGGMGDVGVALGLVCGFRDTWPIFLVLQFPEFAKSYGKSIRCYLVMLKDRSFQFQRRQK